MVWDTVRADHVTPGGLCIRDTTPFLAQLAARGVLFTKARSAAGWTLPAHASIFTGRLPSEHGCHFEHRYLADEAVTIAETLRDGRRPYATAGFSCNVNVSRAFNLAQGFDHFAEIWTDPEVVAGAASGDVLMKRVDEWLARKTALPRFAFINLMDAHLPYTPAAGFEDRFGEGGNRLSAELLDAPDLFDRVVAGELTLDSRFCRALEARYDNAIRGLDERLRQLFERLAAYGMAEDTVVIVTSDHGENLGDHGLVDHQASLHETVLRVPLVISGAGVEAGVTVSEPVTTMALFGWIQSLAQRSFHAPPQGSRVPIVSERMRPVAVLDRLAAARPQVDRNGLARRGIAMVAPQRDDKLLRIEGQPDRLVGVPRRPGDEAFDRSLDGPIGALGEQLDQIVARRQVLAERFRPEVPALSDEDVAELRRRGYLGGAKASTAVSVHAQEHLARGNRAFAEADLQAARRDYEAASQLCPGFADAWFNLAIVTEKLTPAAALPLWQRYLEVALSAPDADQESIQQAHERIDALGGR